MKDELILFETAKLAKEKGCTSELGLSPLAFDFTQSLLQRWLREKHNILLTILPWKDHAADVNDSYTFRPMIVNVKTWEEYPTWEEALEKGLQEALKLIKTKNK